MHEITEDSFIQKIFSETEEMSQILGLGHLTAQYSSGMSIGEVSRV